MLKATEVVRRADLAGRITVDTVTLDRAARWRRRVLLKTDRGHEFLLDLPEATYLADGDALRLQNGAHIRVVAAAEPLLEIHAHGAADLARIAWHIGNRHTPCEVTAGAIYIQPDHVLEAMVVGLGAHVHRVSRPFEPEAGAYGHKGALVESHHASAHSHTHAHSHSHTHAHGPSQSHAHSHAGSHHSHDHDH
jgi:urease accessory protein